MIEDLARMILNAQSIHEKSWGDETDAYTIGVDEAVRMAGEMSGLDVRANDLVRLLLGASWNDAGNWAAYCLQKQRYQNVCDHCAFMGQWEDYDIFFCNSPIWEKKTVVIKSDDFTGVETNVHQLLGNKITRTPQLRHAIYLAKKRGFIKE